MRTYTQYFATAALSNLFHPMSFHRGLAVALGVLAVLASLFWQVSNVVRINSLLIYIEASQRQLDSLETLIRHERATIARLESAERIRRFASQRLGMIDPPGPPILIGRLR